MDKRRKKGRYNLYNITVIICFALIVLSLCIIFEPDKYVRAGIESVQTMISKSKEEKEISQDDAKDIAIEKFKELGENDITKDDIKAIQVEREDELYYYVYTKKNSIEISIKGAHITRINAVPVTE